MAKQPQFEKENLNYVMETFKNGIDAARKFFNYDKSNPIEIAISNFDARVPVYFHDTGKIGLPLKFLQQYIAKGIPLERLKTKSVEIGTIMSQERKVPFPNWLTAAGIEETTHLLQDRGHSPLVQPIPTWPGYTRLSKLHMALSAHEVEAREYADKILPTIGMPPMWAEIDDYLKSKHPDLYGKPVGP